MNLDTDAHPTEVRLRGPFQVLAEGPAYLYATAQGSACEFWLRGDGARRALLDRAQELALEWRASAVHATVTGAASSAMLELQAAAVHTPLRGLYACLPLQSYDAGARAFWRKVFFVVRLPGGRRLLHWLARRPRRLA
jgi:hypothetical protein